MTDAEEDQGRGRQGEIVTEIDVRGQDHLTGTGVGGVHLTEGDAEGRRIIYVLENSEEFGSFRNNCMNKI